MKKSDLSLLIGLAGVIVLVVVFLVVIPPIQDKTTALETENISLKSQVELYQAVNANLATYEEEIDAMEAEIAAIGEAYPINITREDEIMFLANLEDKFPKDIAVQTMSMQAFTEVQTDQGGNAAAGTELVRLYKQPTSYNFVATYQGLKDLVTYLKENTHKKGIDSVTLALSTDTGNLNGTMVLNQFYMTGLDKEYQPIKVPSVRKGIDDVFHTVKSAGGVNADSTEPEVVEEETEEETEE